MLKEHKDLILISLQKAQMWRKQISAAEVKLTGILAKHNLPLAWFLYPKVSFRIQILQKKILVAK